MFALEIEFHDGVSTPETLLVRRPHAIVGTSEFAHVVIEGAASSLCEMRISRGLGREFNCQAVKKIGAGTFALSLFGGNLCGFCRTGLRRSKQR